MLYMVTKIIGGTEALKYKEVTVTLMPLEEKNENEAVFNCPTISSDLITAPGDVIICEKNSWTKAPDENSSDCDKMIILSAKYETVDKHRIGSYRLIGKKFGIITTGYMAASPFALGISLGDKLLVQKLPGQFMGRQYKIIRNLTKEQLIKDNLIKQL